MGRLVFKDIALPVTSKRAFLFRTALFKAQGTRHKVQVRHKVQGTRHKVQVRHKAQETRRQVKKSKKKGTRVESLVPWYLVSVFSSFLGSWLLILGSFLCLVPCLLNLTEGLVFQNLKLHASVHLTSFVGFVCSHWFGFTITLRGYATFRNTFRNNVLTY